MNLYGLIGYPLGHSFSKQYFTQKFEKEDQGNCAFELFPLQSIKELSSLLNKTQNIKGLAVTIPYKESVIPYLDSLTPQAQAIGAVNCIKPMGNMLVGHNTDCIGFERSLLPLLNEHLPPALVLGSGGSSKAVQYVLQKLGIGFLVVGRKKSTVGNHITYEDINASIIEKYQLIINCTPVGMFPNVNEEPKIPYQYLSASNILYDMVYNPGMTNFLKNAIEKGATVKNGYEMLVIQAEENWLFWNGL
jgi:shikimate dehydrogenase